jgi:hypothetical protein
MVCGRADDAVANKLERQAVELYAMVTTAIFIRDAPLSHRKDPKNATSAAKDIQKQSGREWDLRDDRLLRFCTSVEPREIRLGSGVIGDDVKGVLEVISSRN